MSLREVKRLDRQLESHFKDRFVAGDSLTGSIRKLRDQKKQPFFHWFKFNEAFSPAVVEYLLRNYGLKKGRLLDPFAGSGTALFAAAGLGLEADGIELLPLAREIIKVYTLAKSGLTVGDIKRLSYWKNFSSIECPAAGIKLNESRIYRGAYPPDTKQSIEYFLCAIRKENSSVQSILQFALLCILESVSYTQKDGQYLRWDYRPAPFSFEQAFSAKINDMIIDLQIQARQNNRRHTRTGRGSIYLYESSCLKVLPDIQENIYDLIITSPPYCNGYDYLRTYALELALLGLTDRDVEELRQEMLSCTSENRAKDLLSLNPRWSMVLNIVEKQDLLQSILRYFDDQKIRGRLKTDAIPNLVKGYFYEMACVIMECSRVLKTGSPMFMINDNVRLGGVNISVDLVLSALAENLGFRVENIFVLPGDNNEISQPMSAGNREKPRKCLYVWRKEK